MSDYSKSKIHHLVKALYQEKKDVMGEVRKRYFAAMSEQATKNLLDPKEAPAVVEFALERLWEFRKAAEGLDLIGYLHNIVFYEVRDRNLTAVLKERGLK